MKNNWKYSTLTQAEKLKRIAQGDIDVFNTEKLNTDNHISLLKQEGIDASAYEEYAKKLDDTFAKSSVSLNHKGEQRGLSNAQKAELEKDERYVDYRAGEANFIKNVRENLAAMTGQYRDSIEQLQNEQKKTTEWFVNNGYRNTGELEEVEKYYNGAIKKLRDEYNEKSDIPTRILGIRYKNDVFSL